jgi:hypothetical protein
MTKIFIALLETEYASGNLSNLINKSLCLSDVLRILGYSTHGRYTKGLKQFCEINNIDISHFTKNGKHAVEYITKTCPQCNTKFSFKKSEQKQTCSHACANKFFAYKQGAKNKKDGTSSYINVATKYYQENNKPIICCVCGTDEILDVHHFDEDRLNNSPDNLVFICPNHHAMYHRYKDEKIINSLIKELDSRFDS